MMNPPLLLQKLKTNWKSGLTVALVSIPLSVSLAVASESTPTAGIITAIWAGLIASLFGGSHFNIVGPTGALSGILAAYALQQGAEALPVLAIVAGIFILLGFFLHIERFLVFIPASTIHGFTLGVAVIIAASQLNFALGLTGLPAHEHFRENLRESVAHLGNASWETFLCFALGLGFLLLLNKMLPKLPGAILLAPLGILLGYLSEQHLFSLPLQTLGMKFPDMAPKLFEVPTFALELSIIVPAVTVALVAILETMISAKIADGMTQTKHDKQKELLGLGLANIGSGLLGGLPATAALARTSLNIKTGGNDRLSATISSFAIFLISFLLLKTFQFIPLALVASILVFVAIRMVEREHFERMLVSDKKSLVLSLLVAGVTVLVDPMTGIIFGTAIALLLLVEKLSHGQFELIVNNAEKKFTDKITAEQLDEFHAQGETIIYSIKGQLAYINGSSHIARFEQKLNGYKHVILRLRELSFIDLDGVDAFNEIVTLIEGQGKIVLITGINTLITEMLKESPVYQDLEKRGLVFRRTSDALAYLGYDRG